VCDATRFEPGPLPQMRVDLDALESNVSVMARWADDHHVGLLPHVKTTMSAPVVARQLAAGADGVTVATVGQAETAAGWAPPVLLIANEIVDQDGLRRLHGLAGRTDAEVLLLVDSIDGVELLSHAVRDDDRGVGVLLDVGAAGGRTGVRSIESAVDVARAAASAPGMRLVGVSGYEGVRPNVRDPDTLAAVDAQCRMTNAVFDGLSCLYETDRPVLTMGGSAFPDRVVANLAAGPAAAGTRRWLRSGCYVTHDHGTYARVSPVVGLRPAITVRAAVLSTPEAGVAVVGAGKRELPHDLGSPVLVGAWSADGRRRDHASVRTSAMWDHHALLDGVTDLVVGDIVELGISHPCSAFARWQNFAVTRAGRVVDRWRTEFDRASGPPQNVPAV
jgi:D-serine deaminase-like pyridoxal phosphate-dependent protein